MPQLDDKVDLAGSGDGTSVCVAGGGGIQILGVHSLVDIPRVLRSYRGNTCRLLPMVDH